MTINCHTAIIRFIKETWRSHHGHHRHHHHYKIHPADWLSVGNPSFSQRHRCKPSSPNENLCVYMPVYVDIYMCVCGDIHKYMCEFRFTYIYVYIYICVSLSLHRPLQEFSLRLKASRWPRTQEQHISRLAQWPVASSNCSRQWARRKFPRLSDTCKMVRKPQD